MAFDLSVADLAQLAVVATAVGRTPDFPLVDQLGQRERDAVLSLVSLAFRRIERYADYCGYEKHRLQA